MSRIRSALRSWAPVVTAFLIGAAFVGSAWAAVTNISGNLNVGGKVTARNFEYKNPKTNMLVIPGSAFVGNLDFGYSGRAYTEDSIVAPVNLPHGAVVTKVVWWHDSSVANEAEFHLEANTRNDGHDDMVDGHNAACASTPCSTKFTSVSPNAVNNNKRSYGIWIDDDGATVGFSTFSVVIFYKTDAVGPATSMPAGGEWTGRSPASHG